jgi:hypothetical protein
MMATITQGPTIAGWQWTVTSGNGWNETTVVSWGNAFEPESDLSREIASFAKATSLRLWLRALWHSLQRVVSIEARVCPRFLEPPKAPTRTAKRFAYLQRQPSLHCERSS